MSTNPNPGEWGQQPPSGGGFPPPQQYPPASGPVVLPKSLDLSVKLWIAAAGLSMLRSILSVVNTNAIVDETAARLGVSLDAARSSVAGIGSVIFTLFLTALWVFFVWQMRSGQNWARIVLTVIGGIVLLFGVIGLLGMAVYLSIGALGALEMLFQFAALALIAGAIVYQFKPDANPYFVRR
jgi:hypothetical protein